MRRRFGLTDSMLGTSSERRCNSSFFMVSSIACEVQNHPQVMDHPGGGGEVSQGGEVNFQAAGHKGVEPVTPPRAVYLPIGK